MIDDLNSSLDWPDHPLWYDEMDYSYDVARRLTRAYFRLRQVERSEAPESAYLLVYGEARNCQGRAMSLRQLMLVHYLLGLANVRWDGDYGTAFDHFNEALTIAEQIRDLNSTVRLSQLAGSVARATSNCILATECFTHALTVLRSLPTVNSAHSVAPSFELDLLLSLVGNEFAFGAYLRAQSHIGEARSLLASLSHAGLRAAVIDSFDSLLLRWQGRPGDALTAALRAAETYVGQDMSRSAKLSFDRQSAVVADIALDLAESRQADGYGSDHHQYVELARPHMLRALQLAREIQDIPGLGLAELTRVRFERVAGYAANGRADSIEDVIKAARKMNDVALLGQAQTALGHELASLGRAEQSRTRYRKALDILNDSEVPAMGVWARRALLWHSETSRRRTRSVR